MNYMKKVAQMLGVELGESFKVRCSDGEVLKRELIIAENGLFLRDGTAQLTASSPFPALFISLFTGEAEIVKLPWKPKVDERYYYVDEVGLIFPGNYKGDIIDAATIAFGNCFRTREEAEAHAEEILAKIREVLGE